MTFGADWQGGVRCDPVGHGEVGSGLIRFGTTLKI